MNMDNLLYIILSFSILGLIIYFHRKTIEKFEISPKDIEFKKDVVNLLEDKKIPPLDKPDITTIKDKVADLETLTKFINDPIKYNSIRSHQNGLKLNLSQSPNDNDTYIIKVNDGCLQIDSDGSYSVKPCSLSNQYQQFKIENIYDKETYNAYIDLGIDAVKPTDNIKYPFSILKSSINDRCLQNNNGALSVEPCVVRRGQRWETMDRENTCPLIS